MESTNNWFSSSIKVQIITVVGGIFSILTILTTMGILLQWRALVLERQQDNVASFARAFSVPVTDILIHSDNQQSGAEFLESQINSFMENVDDLIYTSVVNPALQIIAHSELRMFGDHIEDPHLIKAIQSVEDQTRIYYSDGKWIIEAMQPLKIGNKQWGTLILGMDATHFHSNISRTFIRYTIIAMLALGLVLTFIYLFVDRILASLNELIEEVDKTDIDQKEPLRIKSRNDEIGVLISRFGKLRKRLQDSKDELQKIHHQVYQTEKLASIGRLAAGVAHEVNNPLNGIRFCIYGIQEEPENKKQTQAYLKLINEGLEQIESVVTKLLGFSREKTSLPAEVDISEQIQIVIDLLEFRISKSNVQIVTKHEPRSRPFLIDGKLIQEIMMNLLLNSLDATGPNGQIVIQTAFIEDQFVRIRVKDNGCGIPEENLEKVFEPFFTTKETGKGTGLGLSVTMGAIKAMGGTIEIESRLNKGTIFEITLPEQTEHAEEGFEKPFIYPSS